MGAPRGFTHLGLGLPTLSREVLESRDPPCATTLHLQKQLVPGWGCHEQGDGTGVPSSVGSGERGHSSWKRSPLGWDGVSLLTPGTCCRRRGSLPSVLGDTPVLAVALQLAQATGKAPTASSLPSPLPRLPSPLSQPPPSRLLPLQWAAAPRGGSAHPLLPTLCLNPLLWAWC